VDTVLYIALALLFVSCVGFVTAAYAHAVRRHRREQAIRGLLDVATAAAASAAEEDLEDRSSWGGSSFDGGFNGGVCPSGSIVGR
jgi:hypothetical protein